MKRRTFLIAFSGFFLNSYTKSLADSTGSFDYWSWMIPSCQFSKEEWKKHFRDMKKAGIKKVFLQVYTGSRALFKNDLLTDTKCDVLKEVLPIAKDEGIQIHAWIWTLMNASALLKKRQPDWYMINKLGQSSVEHPAYVRYYSWLCPSKRSVQDYLLKVITELLQYEGLAGIHLDYIRYPDVILPPGIQPKYNLHQVDEEPQFDYCYCPDCRRIFQNQTGVDPLSINNIQDQLRWNQFRYGQINKLVALLSKRIKQKGLTASAAVFATPKLAKKFVRQSWTQWPLDYIFPMIYHKFYDQPLEWIYEATKEGIEAVRSSTKIVSGLFLNHISVPELEKAINFARNAGARGVSFFNYNRMIRNPEYLQVLQNKRRG